MEKTDSEYLIEMCARAMESRCKGFPEIALERHMWSYADFHEIDMEHIIKEARRRVKELISNNRCDYFDNHTYVNRGKL